VLIVDGDHDRRYPTFLPARQRDLTHCDTFTDLHGLTSTGVVGGFALRKLLSEANTQRRPSTNISPRVILHAILVSGLRSLVRNMPSVHSMCGPVGCQKSTMADPPETAAATQLILLAA
jgi:hypothetical protein